MDPVNIWKKILLQWIKECNFLEVNFYSIDQTEIEQFFIHFKDRCKDGICRYNNLSSFLKEEYPLFEPHLDDENTLSASDHIYVYSLLLHFSCVRYSEPFFQENCKKLDEFAQQNITAFFQKLLNDSDECLTKEKMRHVIASIHVFTPPTNNRFIFNNIDSPIKTPRKITDISPPTPRSSMLEEKNKKVNSLQVQLENFEYEKLLLETDLKKRQEKIDKLNLELKKSHQEVQALKNDVLRSRESDDCGVRHSGEEQIRRLNKKIAQKEQEIAQHRETIENLSEEKEDLTEKLNNAEKQIKQLQNNIIELAEKVDDLSIELEEKESKIQNLSYLNNELEQNINEIRSSTVNSRPDLNMSSEFLDLSRATNSSGSLNSPENLGLVVDIKLREKEHENERLLEEISSIRNDNAKLSKAMRELTERYSKIFDVCFENLITHDDDYEDGGESCKNPGNYFIIFSNCMESFARSFDKIKVELRQIEEQNLKQASKLEEMQNQNTEHLQEIKDLLSDNNLLQTTKSSLEKTMVELENKLENCLKERSEEANNVKNLQKELASLRTEKLESERSFQQQIEKLNSSLETKDMLLEKLQLENADKVRLLNKNQQKIEEFNQEKMYFETKIFDLEVKENQLLEQLEHEKSRLIKFECELGKSKQSYDALLIDSKTESERNKQNRDILEQRIQTLTDDQSLKASIISKLETDKESLTNSMQKEIQSLSNVICEYKQKSDRDSSQLTEITKKMLHTEAELSSSQQELQKVSSQLEISETVFNKATSYILQCVTDLGLEANNTNCELVSCNFNDIKDCKLKEQAKSLVDEFTSIKNSWKQEVDKNSSLRKKLSELENTTDNLQKEKFSLKERVSHLESKLSKSEANLRNQITTMNSTIEKLELEVLNKTNDEATLLEKLKQADQFTNDLKEKIIILETASKAANEKMEKYSQELENTKVQLSFEIADKIKTKEELEKTTENINQLQLTISSLETQLEQMKNDASRASEELRQELNKETTEKQQVQKELQEVRLQCENLATEKVKLAENLKDIKLQTTQNINQLESTINCLEAQLERMKNDASKTSEELSKELEQSKKQLNNEAAEKIKLAENLEDIKLQTSENIKQLEATISSLEAQLERVKNDASKASEELSQELEKTRIDLNNEATEKQRVREELHQVRLQCENILTEKNKLAENMKTKEAEKLRLQKLQFEATQKQQAELHSITVQLETEIDKAKNLVDDLAQTRIQLQNEVKTKHQLEKDLEETKNRVENEVSTKLEKVQLELRNEVQKKTKITEDFESIKLRLESEVTEKMQIQENLQETKSQLEKKLLEIQELTEECENIKLQLEDKHSENQKLTEEHENLKLQLERKLAENQDLTEECETIKSQLESKLMENQKLIEDHESIKLQLESKVTEEHESLKLQLERKLAENQELTEECETIKSQLESKLMENQKLIEESIKLQLESKLTDTSKAKEDLDIANEELNVLRLKVNELENKLQENLKLQLENETQIKDKLEKANNELTKLQATIVTLEAQNEAIKQKSEDYHTKLEDTKQELKKEATAFENANKQLNKLKHEKSILQNEYQVLITEAEQSRIKVKRLENEEIRLLEELQTLKTTSESEIKKCNKEASEQKENVSRLIQEIASIRKEKEQAEDEKKIMSKRLESLLNDQKLTETNQRSIEERLQVAEKEILVKLNLLKTEQLKCQDLENQIKKSQLENAKLRETCESNVKRIEKQALKLGECQANSQKFKKEAEASQSSLENLKSSTEITQRENSRLVQENKSLKEKCTKSEKAKDQLESMTQTLQREIEKLTEQKKTLETSENNLKASNSTLEKIKHNLEEKVRKLAKSLGDLNVAVSRLEQDKVQLNLEVGGLNKQLQEYKTLLAMKVSEIEALTSNLIDAKNTYSQLLELNEKHQVTAKEIDEENSRLNDQLSKLTLRLQINQEDHTSTKTELEDLRSDIQFSKLERDAIEKDHRAAVERLMGIEELVQERRSSEVEFANTIKSLEAQISKLSTDNFNLEELRNKYKLEIDQLNNEIAILRAKLENSQEMRQEQSSTETNRTKSLESQISKLSIDICNLEELRSKDKLMIDQLNEDIKIFTAKLLKSRGVCEENEKKWADERDVLLAEVRESEQRIKDTRLELEGKLEKMKNKMKTLYNDEVTKMKKKQERETAVYKTEIDQLKSKNEKHEAHIKKLSSQIFRLNENLLEYQKENTFLKTKINDLENKPRQLSRGRSTSSVSSAPSHQVLSSNLRMEDEEGEIFNNTYLSDLKEGRMSEYFNTEICAQELQYRNSLLPPHLKSTYFAQFDHQMGEDEIRETPTLDDSSSTLLNTGQRKKVSGATSYKRPGPPTPSKNAGRLSFGGIGELNREILKESIDVASCSSSSSKTPAKFKFFCSKLSMKGDERKSYVTNFKRKLLSGGGGSGGGSTIQCSSTPRKSKAHIDQRRLLDQIMSTASPSGPEFSPDCIVKPAVNLPSSLKKLELNRRMSLFKWRQPKLTYASDSGNSDVMNSPQIKNIRYGSGSGSGSGSKKRSKRSKDRRGSIYFRGSMFARNCRTPTTGFREVFKKKSKVQRNAIFNKYRHEVLNEMLIKKASLCPDNWDEFCSNNNNEEFFLKDFKMNKHSNEDNGNSCGEDVEDDGNYNKSSKHFQQLLEAKESHAPFEISEINSNPSCYNINNSSSNVHSRTIYGASVILNRKIPNVSTTMVRKSSIYVKGVDGKSVILVTNQTITLKDLAQMWLQMNISAKSFIALILTATFIGIISVVINFLYR